MSKVLLRSNFGEISPKQDTSSISRRWPRGTLKIFCFASILSYGRFAAIIRRDSRGALPFGESAAGSLRNLGEHRAEAEDLRAFIHGQSPWSSAKADKRGSLLVEVLLCVVILSAALTFMIQSMTSSVRAIRYGSDYTAAMTLLDNQMAQILSKGSIAAGLQETEELTESPPIYKYSLQTKPWGTSQESKTINEVDAIISWRSGRRDHEIKLTTFLFAISNEEPQSSL